MLGGRRASGLHGCLQCRLRYDRRRADADGALCREIFSIVVVPVTDMTAINPTGREANKMSFGQFVAVNQLEHGPVRRRQPTAQTRVRATALWVLAVPK